MNRDYVTRETFLAQLAAGDVFEDQNPVPWWYSDSNIISNRQYRELEKEGLVRNGKAWSPELQAEMENEAEVTRQSNKHVRLHYWMRRLATRHSPLEVQEVIEELWHTAESRAITDELTDTESETT